LPVTGSSAEKSYRHARDEPWQIIISEVEAG